MYIVYNGNLESHIGPAVCESHLTQILDFQNNFQTSNKKQKVVRFQSHGSHPVCSESIRKFSCFERVSIF
jgi:hypothetical protein